jgi:membrane-associated phospholipid phosphatase
MLTGLESGLGLDTVTWLQAHGNGLFDVLAKALHFTGGTFFYMGVLALIFWSVNRALGLRLLSALLPASIITEVLKALFDTPRPFQAFPDAVTPLVDQSGPGLPSGHVLISLVVWGALVLWLKDRRFAILLAVYVVVIGWSRLYAGVHYPQDIAAGALLGGLVLWLWAWLIGPGSAWLAAQTTPVVIGIVAAIGVLSVVLTESSEAGQTLAGVVLGCGIGLLWEWRAVKFSAAGSVMMRVGRYVGGLILVAIVYVGLKAAFSGLEPHVLFRVIRYAGVGLTMTALWPWLFVRLGLATTG